MNAGPRHAYFSYSISDDNMKIQGVLHAYELGELDPLFPSRRTVGGLKLTRRQR